MSIKVESIEELLASEGYTQIKQEDAAISISPKDTEEGEFLHSFADGLREAERVKAQGIAEDEDLATGESALPIHAMDYNVESIVDLLTWHMERVSKRVIGREDVIKQIIFSIITGEHLLLLSRTGMAKSYLVNNIFNIFEGARLFSSQASKDQTPDNYFGPYNIEEFKRGRIKHNIKGSIIESNFVFLDEFFDASDVVLRSLLSVLNERKFINGAEQIDVAIHTSIATANYMRLNEVTEAVLDRFIYKAILPEDSNIYSQLMIDKSYSRFRGSPFSPEGRIPFEHVLYLHDIIKNNNSEIKIKIPDEIALIKNIIVNRYSSEMRKSDPGFFISPRKQAKILDFLKAQALINKRFEVTLDDLREMHFPLCTLNSYISVKEKDKSESDIFNEAFQQAQVHINASGALPQIQFLLNVRKVFQEIKDNPEEKDTILERRSIIDGLVGFIRKIFPSRFKEAGKSELTVDVLKKQVLDLQPVIEEVRELKDGIIREYWGLQ